MAVDYGFDLSCTTGIDPRGATVSGRILVAQAIFRRLITPRGRLIGDPNYGTDITEFINDDTNKTGIAVLRASIKAECRKDERVDDVSVSITNNNGKYTIIITLDVGDGPFDLTLAVSDVTVELLSVGV